MYFGSQTFFGYSSRFYYFSMLCVGKVMINLLEVDEHILIGNTKFFIFFEET